MSICSQSRKKKELPFMLFQKAASKDFHFSPPSLQTSMKFLAALIAFAA